MTPKQRAEHVASMPHVQRWIRRFRGVAAAMPPEVWVFAGNELGGHGCVIMAHGEDNSAPMLHSGGGVEHDGIVASIYSGSFDGGGF